MTKGQFAFNNEHAQMSYTNRQVVGVNEGQIALALLKGQEEMTLGMSRDNHRNLE